MNLNKFLGGLIVLGIGLLLLLSNFGYLDTISIAEFWKYWPIIIVVIGLSILFKAMPKPLEVFFSILLSLAMIAGLAFVITSAVQRGSNAQLSQRIIDKQLAEPFNEEAENAQIEIATGASKLTINGGSSLLLEGTIESIIGSPSVSRRFIATSKTDVIKVAQNSTFWRGGWGKSNKNDWNLKINNDIKTKLEIDAGASTITANLQNTNVDALDLDAGASKINLDLATKSEFFKGSIGAGASTINIRTPKDRAIKVVMNTGASSNNLEKQGLSKNDKTFSTVDYDNASQRIELSIDAGASTINLERY